MYFDILTSSEMVLNDELKELKLNELRHNNDSKCSSRIPAVCCATVSTSIRSPGQHLSSPFSPPYDPSPTCYPTPPNGPSIIYLFTHSLWKTPPKPTPRNLQVQQLMQLYCLLFQVLQLLSFLGRPRRWHRLQQNHR